MQGTAVALATSYVVKSKFQKLGLKRGPVASADGGCDSVGSVEMDGK